MSTKAVSWVPIVGGIIPDESQEMRIRLKIALIDVATGQWDAFSPKPIQDTSASARSHAHLQTSNKWLFSKLRPIRNWLTPS